MAWKWNKERKDAFEASKRLLTSTKVLTHFDPAEEIVLACDASSYGVGAVLSHKKQDGKERPIAFASRTLSSAERNYSQIEREALACIFGVKRFHQYLYGRKFILHTDHKPLLTLFSSSRGIPSQVSARIQRWALTMAAYEYDIKYKKTSQHGNADGLSRLPLTEPDEEQSEVPTEVVLLVEALEDAPMTYAQIQRWTKRDPLLSKISQFILHGWREERNEGDEELKPYWTRRLELSLHEGCILWGNRVVIPTQGREYVLRELHAWGTSRHE